MTNHSAYGGATDGSHGASAGQNGPVNGAHSSSHCGVFFLLRHARTSGQLQGGQCDRCRGGDSKHRVEVVHGGTPCLGRRMLDNCLSHCGAGRARFLSLKTQPSCVGCLAHTVPAGTVVPIKGSDNKV